MVKWVVNVVEVCKSERLLDCLLLRQCHGFTCYTLSGNLVMHRRDNNEVRWAANSHGLNLGAMGPQPRTLLLANDGNIEYYDGNGNLLWTFGWADNSLSLTSSSSGSTLNGPLCSFAEGDQSQCLGVCQTCDPGMCMCQSAVYARLRACVA